MRRMMYVEKKAGLEGPGRIGWVTFSKTARSYYYGGRRLAKIKSGYKYNCLDAETGDEYWISGPHRDGQDRLYGGVVEIDEDAREDYWVKIRKQPENMHLKHFRSTKPQRD